MGHVRSDIVSMRIVRQPRNQEKRGKTVGQSTDHDAQDYKLLHQLVRSLSPAHAEKVRSYFGCCCLCMEHERARYDNNDEFQAGPGRAPADRTIWTGRKDATTTFLMHARACTTNARLIFITLNFYIINTLKIQYV